MTKVLKLLLLALISLMVMGCSDSDDNYQPGIIGYETFLNAKNAWKEPASYSFTVDVSTRIVDYYMIDVKVANGKASFSINPNQRDFNETVDDECRRIKEMGWNMDSIKDLLESMNEKAVAACAAMGHHVVYTDWKVKTVADIIAHTNYVRNISQSENYYILIRYDEMNGLNAPIVFSAIKPDREGYTGSGGSHSIAISNFKVLEE